ncbi:NAD-binding protein [Fomitopsis schrenkii]|uniref:NAD-binding protein n=1 Tax=Fomitopsis schrenkii TaxID=2126942 RepID=S8FML3_FOMSC|nr:NAD-binding protein [Fomitopsis schrenkii]
MQHQEAWRVLGRGDPWSVLSLDSNIPVPSQLFEGEVLVRIQAAALNPIGYKTMRWPFFSLTRPYIPENDIAGVVIDGNGTALKEGDWVFGWIPLDYAFRTRQGALAQYVRLPATCLVNLPPNVNPVQAAGLTCAAMTAYQALFEVGALRQGQRVFINGASSAVGAFAVQLAKAAGCRVSGSASARNQEFVEGIGVDEFHDYTAAPLHKVLTTTSRYDVLIDAVGLLDTSLYTHSAAYLQPAGIFVSTGPQPRGFDVLGIIRFLWEVFLRPGFLGGTRRAWKMVRVKHKREDLERICQYVAEGKLRPIVDEVYAFEDVHSAYMHLMTGHARGKVVVKVDPAVEG